MAAVTRTGFTRAIMPDPGTELFRSDRRFRPFRYGLGHTEFLLRSYAFPDGPDPTIDIEFSGTRRMLIRDGYDGLVVRLASVDQAAAIKAETPKLYGRFSDSFSVFLLESDHEVDYVVAATIVWGEGVLTPGRRDVLTNPQGE